MAPQNVLSEIVTEILGVDPVQAPLHRTNLDPAAGVATSPIFNPSTNVEDVHCKPQLIPAGCEITNPLPVPRLELVITLRTPRVGTVKIAVQLVFPVIVMTTFGELPVQLPLQDTKVDPALAEASKLRVVPRRRTSAHC